MTRTDASGEVLMFGAPRLRLLLEVSSSGVLVSDAFGTIFLMNDQIESLFGYQKNELVGQHIDILFPKDPLETGGRKAQRLGGDDFSVLCISGIRKHSGVQKGGSSIAVSVELAVVAVDGEQVFVASILESKRGIIAEEITTEPLSALLQTVAEAPAFLEYGEQIEAIPSFNLDAFAARYRGRGDVLFQKFPTEARRDFSALSRAAADMDREAISRLLHGLKSICSAVCADRLRFMVASLESCHHTLSVDETRSRVSSLENEFEKFLEITKCRKNP